ncbi:MAG: bifunctional DNA-formamidopyrimidine glycosylase/DNA-(apurinic or apyrimidinic site) lyase [Rhodoglobus sp.]
MPELPEVEVVRRGLAPAVDGAVVASVEVLDERSLRRHVGGAFEERLAGRRMLAPERRGKFLWIPLADSDDVTVQELPHAAPVEAVRPAAPKAETPEPREALVVHLGMSGQVLLREPGVDDARTRIRIDLEHPAHGPVRLNFVDQRIFGSMAIDRLVPAADHPDECVPSHVAHIARDPLDGRFDEARFLTRLEARRTTIKRALLDQSLVSGIGNIYADEALWAARVHYEQPTATLSRRRARALLAEVRLVLEKALAEGGTSFDAQYLNVNGQSGYFAHSLNAYGRQGEPCPRCGTPIVRESFMNRGSHFCPRCQKVR